MKLTAIRLTGLMLVGQIVLNVSTSFAETPETPSLVVRSKSSGEADYWPRQLVLKAPKHSHERWAGIIRAAAEKENLPEKFLEKLLSRESDFFPFAVSRGGAQGIAQFMPRTASGRSLEDPFDANQAIPAAASYIGHLQNRFGNLGLAAAAYNAGPKKVSDWLAGAGVLPAETIAYVRAVTGKDVVEWLPPDRQMALIAHLSSSPVETPPPSRSATTTLRQARARKLSPEATLCASLASAGHACIVKEAY